VAPLLRVEPLAVEPPLDDVGALAFTSPNGVARFAARHPDRALPVFAVGDATAEAARAAGFSRARSAGGDVADLARLILAERDSFAGRLLRAGAQEAAGDLIGVLRSGGVAASSVALYRTVPCAPPTVLSAAGDEAWAAVLIHSPKAGRALAAFADRLPPGRLCVCISPAAAKPLAAAACGPIRVAARPDEPSMIAALRSALGG